MTEADKKILVAELESLKADRNAAWKNICELNPYDEEWADAWNWYLDLEEKVKDKKFILGIAEGGK